MGGVPCLRSIRIPVATVVDMIADGISTKEILGAYPDLAWEDIAESLRYAAEAVKERELPLVKVAGNFSSTTLSRLWLLRLYAMWASIRSRIT